MSWITLRFAAMLLATGLAGCDAWEQLGPSPAPEPPAPAADAAGPDLRQSVGAFYSDFTAAAGSAYSPEALGLAAIDRARVWRAMANARPATLIRGGGSEALVFQGCAEAGCETGLAVVAIDLASGGAFVGVRDVGGADELAQNDRAEALLRLNSPTRDWDWAAPASQAASALDPRSGLP